MAMYTAQQSFDKIVKKFNEGGEHLKGQWLDFNNEGNHCAISSLFYGTELWNEFKSRVIACEHAKDRYTWLNKETGLPTRLIQNILFLWDTPGQVKQYQIIHVLKNLAYIYDLEYNEPKEQILSEQTRVSLNTEIKEEELA